MPEATGAYEARYLTGQKYYTLARHAFEVTSVTASVEGPSTVTEGATFSVRFEGTGNPRDFVTIVPADADLLAVERVMNETVEGIADSPITDDEVEAQTRGTFVGRTMIDELRGAG